MTFLLPISAVVATRNRAKPLLHMLRSLAQQSAQPLEMIVVDGSDDMFTQELCETAIPGLTTYIVYRRAIDIGAATQRNQAIAFAQYPTIWILDDDILFEPDCVIQLWSALQSNVRLGGVNAMITNQRYATPGRISRALFQFLHGHSEESYAGKCIGPALNLLPEDRSDLPEVVPVEWLNTTCVMYRRNALPQPLFPSLFTGYSLMEDVTLSLTVGKHWQLANVRTARIFHDSQPGDHKSNCRDLARMELFNRYVVMTQILRRNQLSDYFKLVVLELFGIAALLASRSGWLALPKVLLGKGMGLTQILTSGSRCRNCENWSNSVSTPVDDSNH